MSGLIINPTPLMTRHLVKELKVFSSDPLTFVDVGARGGMNTEWTVFEDQIVVYCFEPDEAECRRLAADARPQIKYLPFALSASAGQAKLYEAKLPASSSLFKTRMDYFGRLLNRENGVTIAERLVSTVTLDQVVTKYQISNIDFIKLDAEGAEVDILRGGALTLSSMDVLGVLSEIRFQEEINGSPTFAELDILLRPYGLRLYDMQAYRQSRAILPYAQASNYRLPSGERFFANTTRGQVQDGDALYFRDLLILPARLAKPMSVTGILKMCALLEVYSLSDCAAELVAAKSDFLRQTVNPEKLLDLLSTGMAGRPISHAEYIDLYLGDSSPQLSMLSTAERLEDMAQGSAVPHEIPAPEKPDTGGWRSWFSWLSRN